MTPIVSRFRAALLLAALVHEIDGGSGSEDGPQHVGPIRLTDREWARALELANIVAPPEDA